jgi:hypothetical protein
MRLEGMMMICGCCCCGGGGGGGGGGWLWVEGIYGGQEGMRRKGLRAWQRVF